MAATHLGGDLLENSCTHTENCEAKPGKSGQLIDQFPWQLKAKMANHLYMLLCLISTFKQLKSISVQTYEDPVTCLESGRSFFPANVTCIVCGSNMRPSTSGENDRIRTGS